MPVQQTASTVVTTDVKAGKILQSVIAICFGLVIVGFVGFSHLEVVHNAAHDTRHANAFPCH
ncbi:MULTISPECIES: CbtB-domain containing protein [unclassified Sinorhizobium]|uniref:CbtB domain-containing protein n=1 Tax=unclassified Sinorhizobium TaxID=2613772 RepID=UPI003523633D